MPLISFQRDNGLLLEAPDNVGKQSLFQPGSTVDQLGSAGVVASILQMAPRCAERNMQRGSTTEMMGSSAVE